MIDSCEIWTHAGNPNRFRVYRLNRSAKLSHWWIYFLYNLIEFTILHHLSFTPFIVRNLASPKLAHSIQPHTTHSIFFNIYYPQTTMLPFFVSFQYNTTLYIRTELHLHRVSLFSSIQTTTTSSSKLIHTIWCKIQTLCSHIEAATRCDVFMSFFNKLIACKRWSRATWMRYVPNTLMLYNTSLAIYVACANEMECFTGSIFYSQLFSLKKRDRSTV